MRLSSESPEATQKIGVCLGRQARRGDVVALYGDLGAGKTCLIQGFAVGLGIEAPVTSPTFILVAEHRGRLPLYHVDLYRTEHLDEIRALGLDELIDGDGVTLIEWGDKAEPLLPPRCIRVRIYGVGDERRRIELEGLPSDWRILDPCPSPVSPRLD